VYNFDILGLALAGERPSEAISFGLSAYNEVPTIAVAIDCWFRARHHLTRPFLFLSPL
jgi:hypothetical protein